MIRCSTSASRQPRPHLRPWKRSLRKLKSRLKADAANTQSISPTPTATPSNITVTSQRRESFEGPRNQKKFQLFAEPPSGDIAAAPRCQDTSHQRRLVWSRKEPHDSNRRESRRRAGRFTLGEAETPK